MVAIDSTTLSITWSLPSPTDINGIIQYYIVNISVMETLEHHQYHSINTSYIISSFHPYYTYTVYVAAVTVDIGPFSAGYTIRTPQSGMCIKINNNAYTFHSS